ncbi:MAG: FAD-dependent oxidoreductase [Phycisphaerales bacterium]|jgi:glycerol-3-phosphate dehydrogenase
MIIGPALAARLQEARREAIRQRTQGLDALGAEHFDVLVIGGGATGLGVAVDAVTRGLRTAIVEANDWAAGTSSRSTKLVHGGVRYLEQLDFGLVREALRERGLLHRNAPHLVHPLPFIVPSFKWWEGPFYGAGLKLYDALAGSLNLKPSRFVGREEVIARIPNVHLDGLRGGVEYHDGQFDDARMAISLLRTAELRGAIAVRSMRVVSLVRESGRVSGAEASCALTGRTVRIRARTVVNCTGIFADGVRAMESEIARPMIEPAQGVHVVLDRSFQPSDTAIMVPHTDDGRVLFVIPWHGHTLIGTTDIPRPVAEEDPQPTEEEIGFILHNAGRYLQRIPARGDVLAAFAGMRPLVHEGGMDGTASKKVSREHVVLVGDAGLVSVMGGKWTTYRKMAQDGLDRAIEIGGLAARPCETEALRVHGAIDRADAAWPAEEWLQAYGSEASELRSLMARDADMATPLDPRLPYTVAALWWGLRHEQALSTEDLLFRRVRAGLLHSGATRDIASALEPVLAAS